MNPLQSGFSNFKEQAFRFETLPEYRITATEEFAVFQEYLQGGLFSKTGDQEWQKSLKEWTAQGKHIVRVRLLPENFTAYLNFELEWCYPFNIGSGEVISVIDESLCSSLFASIPKDFWLFDSRQVAEINYSQTGEFLGSSLKDNSMGEFNAIRDKLLNNSIPFPEYVKRQRTNRRF